MLGKSSAVIIVILVSLFLSPWAHAQTESAYAKSELVKLAVDQGINPTDAEEMLLWSVEHGVIADFQTGIESEDNPANAAKWGDDRVIRADLLNWLCTSPHATRSISNRGRGQRSTAN